jgi:NAD-dependent epimerase/dehydratase family protein
MHRALSRAGFRATLGGMKVILFGATGMVGQGVLRECLLASDVESVLAVGRSTTGQTHAKLREIVHADLTSYAAIEPELAGYDACFFCLGVSAAGMSEADYTRVTYDVTLAAAEVLARLSPAMTFIYVSGEGTDSTEQKRAMWARVKGRTENALLKLPFKAVMFRPGLIRPLHGIRSKTRLYRIGYTVMWPLFPLFRLLGLLTTTEGVGRAMLRVARDGAPGPILGNRDINQLAAARGVT